MSKENRKMVFDRLVAENRLGRDDGSLIKEFGSPQDLDVSYSSMTIKMLKEHCDTLGLVYTSKSTKDDLVVLLENKSDEEVE